MADLRRAAPLMPEVTAKSRAARPPSHQRGIQMSAGRRPLECDFSLMHSASGRGGNRPGFSFCGLAPADRAKRKVQLRSALCLIVRSPLHEQTSAWSAQMSNPMPHAGQCEGELISGIRSRRRMAIRKRGASSKVQDSQQGIAWSHAPDPRADIN